MQPFVLQWRQDHYSRRSDRDSLRLIIVQKLYPDVAKKIIGRAPTGQSHHRVMVLNCVMKERALNIRSSFPSPL